MVVANVEFNSNNEAVFTSWSGNLLNDKITIDDVDTIILRKESQ